MNLIDALLLRLPFVSELVNQGLSKTSGWLAAFHLLSRTEVKGDYLEFGVFQGDSLRNAIRAAEQAFRTTREGRFGGRFIGFDSFQGLPQAASMNDGVTPYRAGEFTATRASFEQTLARCRARASVEIVEGWFDSTLTADTAQRLRLERAAFINVDCDLYESTVSVLQFVTPLLQTGTILYFDDWFSVHGSMEHGEARATREWLAAHPHIRLIDYRNVGITGRMFIVNLVAAEPSEHESVAPPGQLPQHSEAVAEMGEPERQRRS